MTLEDLQRRVAQYNPRADSDLIAAAYRFSRDAHLGQHRESGEDYIEHPVAVAMILADLELDDVTLAAALLHDVVEDTRATLEVVNTAFGAEVAQLVDGVTKLSRLEYRSREEEQAENLRKMFLAMAKDIRVLLIKLADRLHNMRTLKHLPEERKRSIAQESLDIFAPLAHRLGISRLQWEMEDLALRYLEPKRYYELVELVARKRAEREEYAAEVIAALKGKLGAAGITAEITGRPKHFYSIFRKMYVQGREFDEIYDLVAIRVIVDTVRDCYAVLGIVHSLWKPLPGRFKDYVAMPKSNMYQSLHTTVIGPRGEPFELQIRTWDMHRTAEHGIAAHWRYKEGTRGDVRFEQKLSWLRQVLEWQHDLKDAREFMDSLKIDLFGDEVFVFTPKGDVVDLPTGAMPLDFAYHIHTDVGHRCVGAKVNGKIVPLDYKLVNGDIVEILTSKTGSPSWDWLNLVTTSSAKGKIRARFKKERREENEARGRESLQRELKRQNLDAAELLKPDRLAEVLRRLNYVAEADLLAAIGYGGLTAQQVVSRLKDELRKEKKPEDLEHPVKTEKRLAPTSLGINVEG
ncbi:MAG: bifunctional (p)ppGpp synthetase/guanosine-3',5'-bis(diphosphate) 3'-pyrophosphohydrolase, partial [Bacillota bacterium]